MGVARSRRERESFGEEGLTRTSSSCYSCCGGGGSGGGGRIDLDLGPQRRCRGRGSCDPAAGQGDDEALAEGVGRGLGDPGRRRVFVFGIFFFGKSELGLSFVSFPFFFLSLKG